MIYFIWLLTTARYPQATIYIAWCCSYYKHDTCTLVVRLGEPGCFQSAGCPRSPWSMESLRRRVTCGRLVWFSGRYSPVANSRIMATETRRCVLSCIPIAVTCCYYQHLLLDLYEIWPCSYTRKLLLIHAHPTY